MKERRERREQKKEVNREDQTQYKREKKMGK